ISNHGPASRHSYASEEGQVPIQISMKEEFHAKRAHESNGGPNKAQAKCIRAILRLKRRRKTPLSNAFQNFGTAKQTPQPQSDQQANQDWFYLIETQQIKSENPQLEESETGDGNSQNSADHD